MPGGRAKLINLTIRQLLAEALFGRAFDKILTSGTERQGAAECLPEATDTTAKQRQRLRPREGRGVPPAAPPVPACGRQHLARVVDKEPCLQRDRAKIETLRTIGIEKGRPFAPDDAQRRKLDAGAGLRVRRASGPEPALFGQSWKLEDVERLG